MTDFLALPDLQYAASKDPVMRGIKDHLLSGRCEFKHAISTRTVFTDTSVDEKVKQWEINTAAGADLTRGIGPSAEWLQMAPAFNYR